jgi:FHS family Na+ dependent glucose MFS transporter 1
MLPVVIWVLKLPSPKGEVASEKGGSGAANRPLVALFALFFFLYAGLETSFGSWIFTYVVESNLSSREVAAYLTASFWGAVTVGRLVAVPVAARHQPRQILSVDLVGGLASLGVIVLWPQSLLATWIGTLGLGMSLASIFPTLLTMAGRRMVMTGRITSWFFVGVSTGSMSIPWLIGQFFEPIGPRPAMVILLLDLLVMGGVYLVLIRGWTGPSPGDA